MAREERVNTSAELMHAGGTSPYLTLIDSTAPDNFHLSRLNEQRCCRRKRRIHGSTHGVCIHHYYST